jgi:hypothetical protein
MRIISNREMVDFEAPVWMSDAQVNRFMDFMKDLLPNIIVEKGVHEKERNVTYKDKKNVRWSADEYKQLFDPESNAELAKKLGRNEMSVSMQRAQFIPNLVVWAKKHDYKVDMASLKELVDSFLREQK